jgi:formylglycine-generating enzyme required for sulfatase activity
MKHGIMAAITAFAATVASAASITIDRVAQRWPWNNKVDIYYTVDGAQDVKGSTFARIEFTANIGGTEKTIDGNAIGASASDGEHVATWTAPAGLRASDCTMTARLVASDAPSGDDYMIVDLSNGKVTYEGLLASQDDSNARYNTEEYKTGKMVLRKIPRWADRASLPNAAALPAAGYPTGDNTNYADTNSEANWATKRTYYIGVFPVTQKQYYNITGVTPSADQNISEVGNPIDLRPVNNLSWHALRRPSNDTSNFPSTTKIPPVSSANSGTFFQQLNFKTGLYFDLPTELMGEIAARAGSSGTYPWSSGSVSDYVVCGRAGKWPMAVGKKNANDWGLYDTIGNVFEFCLDEFGVLNNLADAVDPFTTIWKGADAGRRIRSGQFALSDDSDHFRASMRGIAWQPDNVNGAIGFRVAIVID